MNKQSKEIRTIKCPACKKRVFDVDKNSHGSVEVQLKCPHCKNIVHISVNETI